MILILRVSDNYLYVVLFRAGDVGPVWFVDLGCAIMVGVRPS